MKKYIGLIILLCWFGQINGQVKGQSTAIR
jgi:hypothetical protein